MSFGNNNSERDDGFPAKLDHARKAECFATMEIGVAHDYSNFLTAIIGNVGIVMRELPKDSPIRRNVEQIAISAQKALELTNLLSECSGHVNAEMLPVNINTMLEDMKAGLRSIVPEDVKLEFDLAGELPDISGNLSLLQQLANTLICNAAESIQNGDGRILVTTGVIECNPTYCTNLYFAENLPDGSYVYIEVRDNGRGIPKEIEDRIFDPFFSTKIRGRGLGLPTVMGILRAHHGGIRVDSTPGKGSSFRVLLPVNPGT